MIVHQLTGPPPSDLARALAEFEAGFTYPLGPGRSFRIEHGVDYPRFFRAIGEAVSFVVIQEDRVVGTLGVAVQRLRCPDGKERPVAYLGDLKVAPQARGGGVLRGLARVALPWLLPRVEAAYGVVMDGTAVLPRAYTGRIGLPQFQELGRVVVLRLPIGRVYREGDDRFQAASEHGWECFRRLSAGRYAGLGGRPVERSQHPPAWLLHPDGLACGLLEDTRKAKRLIANDGAELLSMHLSHFAFQTPAAGAELLAVARGCCGRLGVPALFVSVSDADAAGLCQALGDLEAVTAPATIYGTGLVSGPAWIINSSEI
jgi:hypothetical protein